MKATLIGTWLLLVKQLYVHVRDVHGSIHISIVLDEAERALVRAAASEVLMVHVVYNPSHMTIPLTLELHHFLACRILPLPFLR